MDSPILPSAAGESDGRIRLLAVVTQMTARALSFLAVCAGRGCGLSSFATSCGMAQDISTVTIVLSRHAQSRARACSRDAYSSSVMGSMDPCRFFIFPKSM